MNQTEHGYFAGDARTYQQSLLYLEKASLLKIAALYPSKAQKGYFSLVTASYQKPISFQPPCSFKNTPTEFH